MYLDDELVVSDSQDISQVAGSYYSSYAVNVGASVDIGAGNPLHMVFVIDAALDSSGGAATCVFAVIDEADATLDGSSVVIAQTKAMTETELYAGKTFSIPLPAGIITQAFIGAKYTIAGETSTAGTVTAFLSNQPAPVNPS